MAKLIKKKVVKKAKIKALTADQKFKLRLAALIEKSEIGEPVKIVETRWDPNVSTSIAVRTEKHGCFLIQVFRGELEVLDCFELEENQKTLRSLEVGPLRFF